MRIRLLKPLLTVAVLACLQACATSQLALDRNGASTGADSERQDAAPTDPNSGPDGSVWLQIATRAHSAPIMRLAADSARDVVVTASDDKTARIWTLSEGRLVAVLRPPVGEGRAGRLFGVAIHPRSDIVAVAGTGASRGDVKSSIWLFSLSNGTFRSRIDARGEHVRRLEWADEGRMIVGCYAQPGAIRFFDPLGRLRHEEAFEGDCLALSSSGKHVAAASRDGTVHLYRIDADTIRRARRIGTGSDPVAIAFSPDATRLAVGFFTPGTGSAVYATGTGARELRLRTNVDVLSPSPTDPISKTLAVAWSHDGRTIHTAGALDVPGRTEGRIRRFSASDGRLLSDLSPAEDSITDLATLPGSATNAPNAENAVAWSSYAGSWGVADGQSGVVRSRAEVPFLTRGAARELRISDDASLVQWVRGTSRERTSFDVRRRRSDSVGSAAATGALTRLSAVTYATDFENHYAPRLNGWPIPMRKGEVSRALTFVGSRGDAILATDEGLRRLDASRKSVWRIETATEVRAVAATVDGQRIVGQLSDGTIRWWRASDGALLLSLLATRGGWVLWSPTGHYDAGHGGESLIGWLVTRTAKGSVPEFFSVGRFRDQYHRPDVIDRILEIGDPTLALRQADLDLQADPSKLSRIRPVTPVPPRASQAPTPSSRLEAPVDRLALQPQDELPPVLAAAVPLRVRPGDASVSLQFSLRTSARPEQLAVELRIDGRRLEPTRVVLPAVLDGSMTAEVVARIPSGARTAQVVVRSGAVASEPLSFVVDGVRDQLIEPRHSNGNLYLLAVGVSKYRAHQIALELPAKDARDFDAIMRRQQGVLYRTIVSRVLTDEAADRSGVVAGLAWLREQVGPEDAGIVFLAGHGVNDRANNYHFLPVDVDLNSIGNSSITGEVMERTLASLRGRAFLFIDTCQAGSSITALTQASRDTARLGNSLSAPENAVTVFASSTDRQDSLENDRWGNGAFTKVLVEGLRHGVGTSNQQGVTNRSLPPFLSEGVARLTEGVQTPVALVPDSLPERIISVPQLP